MKGIAICNSKSCDRLRDYLDELVLSESGLSEILLNKSTFLPFSEELNIKALQTHPVFLQYFPGAAELSSKVTVYKLSVTYITTN